MMFSWGTKDVKPAEEESEPPGTLFPASLQTLPPQSPFPFLAEAQHPQYGDFPVTSQEKGTQLLPNTRNLQLGDNILPGKLTVG